MRQPLFIALLAVPILIWVYFNAGLAYWLNRRLGVVWCVAGPSALIGPATSSSWRGDRDCPSRIPVRRDARDRRGVIVEVPVMLSVVKIVTESKDWYQRGAASWLAAFTPPARPSR